MTRLDPRGTLRQWRDFRQRQRELLRESNRPASHAEVDEQLEQSLFRDLLSPGESSSAGQGAASTPRAVGGSAGSPRDPATEPENGASARPDGPAVRPRFGEAGRPFNRHSPFYLGFVGALGALLAIGLFQTLGRLTTTISILIISLFLTLALNPLVEGLARRGMRRAGAVAIVFLGVLVVFGLLGLLVIPPVVTQTTELTKAAPDYLTSLLSQRWVQDIDAHYGVIEKVQVEVIQRIQDPNFLGQVFGGILGAGRLVASGVFQTITVLILTLYFLASLPRMKHAAYAMVPASRRARVVRLSEEIMRRVGSYAIGQVAIATLNAVCSWIMMSILSIPYAAVLAVAVGFLGLIPMVGATLGAVVVTIVAFFVSPKLAIITVVYYVIYQQIENYVFMPRIMQRTVSVPGAVTVVAALAGGTLLGPLGALLAIPVAAGLLLLYDEVLVPRQYHQ